MLFSATIVWWVCIALTGLVIGIRFTLIIRDFSRPTVVDGFMVLTWICSLVMVSLLSSINGNLEIMRRKVDNSHADGRKVTGTATPMPRYKDASLEIITETYKVQFIISLLYIITLWSAKATLFSIYFAVRSVMKNTSKLMLSLGVAYTVVVFIAVFLQTILWCGTDMSKNWTMNVEDETLCIAIGSEPVMIVSTVATLTTDIIILIIGLIVVRTMSMTGRRETFALVFVFVIAAITIGSILIRFSLIINIIRNNGRFSRWMAVECMCSLIACCLPTTRSILRRVPDRFAWLRMGISPAHTDRSASKKSAGSAYAREGVPIPSDINLVPVPSRPTHNKHGSYASETSLERAVESQPWPLGDVGR
ncbi:hypothetical protein EDC01DRAFT_495687 [Geopyxis carbonaria]|nr:hypothetical protein EDC01DRAFT_495687 [Geopyxis carbonaria]